MASAVAGGGLVAQAAARVVGLGFSGVVLQVASASLRGEVRQADEAVARGGLVAVPASAWRGDGRGAAGPSSPALQLFLTVEAGVVPQAASDVDGGGGATGAGVVPQVASSMIGGGGLVAAGMGSGAAS